MARMPHDVPYIVQLENTIAGLSEQALDPLQRRAHGNAVWTPRALLTISCLMAWDEAQTLAMRFEKARELLAAMQPQDPVPTSYNGYTQALARQLPQWLALLRRPWQKLLRTRAGQRWRTRGWVVFAVDGSRFESPRTALNEQVLGCAGKKRTAPQISHTMLTHLGTGVLWDFRCGPGIDSERRHLEDMLPGLPEGSLITADAGFSGYDLLTRLAAAKVRFLLRVGGNITLLTRHARLVKGWGGEVWLWPQEPRSRPPLVLRLIRLSDQGQAMYLVTNVPAAELSTGVASEIYRQRWGIEVCYRSIKQTLDRQRWLSRSPRTVLAEHQSTILGFWLLQLVGLAALRGTSHDPQRWSVARARDATRRVMRHALQPARTGRPSWHCQLAASLQDDYVRKRSRKARDWPHKKREGPPRPPKVRTLSDALHQRGQKLLKFKC